MATPRSVPASPDGRGTTPHQLHLLRLLDGRYVAICSCRWTGERYHPKRENAYREAEIHAGEHDVQLSFIEARDLIDVPALHGETGASNAWFIAAGAILGSLLGLWPLIVARVSGACG